MLELHKKTLVRQYTIMGLHNLEYKTKLRNIYKYRSRLTVVRNQIEMRNNISTVCIKKEQNKFSQARIYFIHTSKNYFLFILKYSTYVVVYPFIFHLKTLKLKLKLKLFLQNSFTKL